MPKDALTALIANARYSRDRPAHPPLPPPPLRMICTPREVGGGRAPRQPGQVRKEAAATSFRSGRCPASHYLATRPPLLPQRRRRPAQVKRPHVRPVPGRSPHRGPAHRRRPGRPRPVRRRRPGHGRPAGAEPAAEPGRARPGLPRAGPQIPPHHLRRPDRPGSDGAHPAQRLRPRPRRPRLHAHRRARRGQDHHRPHHRPRAELHRPGRQGGPTADPCGVCDNCKAILADRHPDVVEMDAASRTGVDDVREIIEATRFRPLQARAKVFIIDEVHMLSRNAFNALLKTLEEPPPHVKFVFATTELRKVPITVLSRCQRFDLRRVRMGELAAHFTRIADEGRRAGGKGRDRPDRPRRRRQRARRAVAAGPGDRPGAGRRHRGRRHRHARPGRPRAGVRPAGSGDGRPAAQGAGNHRPRA